MPASFGKFCHRERQGEDLPADLELIRTERLSVGPTKALYGLQRRVLTMSFRYSCGCLGRVVQG